MKQSELFLKSEGEAWYARNKDKLPPEHDSVMDIIEKADITPYNVLEFGCADGWRLNRLWQKYGCNIHGIDPYSRWPGVQEGTTSDAPFAKWKQRFDIIIYGFCLYLVDREDLFKTAWVGDYYLKNGGYLIIHDFFVMMEPYKRKYEHADGVYSYKMNYFKLWCTNPAYSVVDVIRPDDDTAVHLLRKDVEKGWPLHE